jgi:two-component system cell cycle sensor histidine kinase/response regulator CckA
MTGTETILLVEDEDPVRAVVRRILAPQGYRVLEARNGAQALSIGQLEAGTIDLLVSDVIMPEMSGPELAKRLGKLRPGMRVLFMSGYTDDTVVRHGILEGHLTFLQKPFTPQTLLAKVREVLDTPAPAPSPSGG